MAVNKHSLVTGRGARNSAANTLLLQQLSGWNWPGPANSTNMDISPDSSKCEKRFSSRCMYI
jgi:hypothetical protein